MQKSCTFEKKKELNVQLQTWDRQFDIFVLRDPPKEMSIAWSWIDPDSRVARELFLESYTERLIQRVIQSLQLRRINYPFYYSYRFLPCRLSGSLIEVHKLPPPTTTNILIPNFVCLREKFKECLALTRTKSSKKDREPHVFPLTTLFPATVLDLVGISASDLVFRANFASLRNNNWRI